MKCLDACIEGNQSKSGFGSLRQTITDLPHSDDVLQEMIEETANAPRNSYLKTASGMELKKLTKYWGKVVMEPEISHYAVITILLPLHPFLSALLGFRKMGDII